MHCGTDQSHDALIFEMTSAWLTAAAIIDMFEKFAVDGVLVFVEVPGVSWMVLPREGAVA